MIHLNQRLTTFSEKMNGRNHGKTTKTTRAKEIKNIY